jgi:dipeptidyl aminopeptidase/acylaminoacyl peptidase
VLVALCCAVLPSAADAAFPGQNGRIAFMTRQGTSDPSSAIWTMDGAGANLDQLTSHAVEDGMPAVSPDGQRIAFTSNRDGNTEVYVMDQYGAGPVNLTNNAASDFDPAFSPDGQKIAFVSNRDGNFEIYVMDADGSHQTRLTTDPAEDSAPTFSPDGQKIAFSRIVASNSHIFAMDANGSNPTDLTPHSDSYSDREPDFSPDGRHIAFTSNRSPDTVEHIYVMDAGGANQTALTNTSASDSYAAFSPDGTKIAFARSLPSQSQYDIYVMDATGANATNLTNSSAQDTYPAWAPRETDPPDTTIDSGPSRLTHDPTPSFAFSSDEPHSTFECRVDAAPFAACTSPHATNSLGNGPHRFEVRAIDRAGNVDASAAGRSFSVDAPVGALGVSIDDGAQFTNDPLVSIHAVWPRLADTMLISNDGGFTSPGVFPVAAETAWTLDSSGPERLPKTVYVRFTGGDSGPETYQDDIILDQTRPHVASASARPRSSRARTYRLSISARDATSGLAKMQVTSTKRKPGKLLKFKRRSTFTSRSRRIYVRVTDRAGNFSAWKRVRTK